MQTKRLIDANVLKDLRDKFIRGEIHFDDESDMVDKCPTINAVPIEELEHLRNELYEHDLITMEGLKRLNTLIGKYTTTHNGGADNGQICLRHLWERSLTS